MGILILICSCVQVYGLASQSEKDYLEKKEFITALKLIAIYQNFNNLDNYESLLGSSKVPLVKLQDEK